MPSNGAVVPNSLIVSGQKSGDLHAGLMGEYVLVEEHTVSDRPVYKHAQLERYLFHAKRKQNKEGDGRWHWWIGSQEKMLKGEGGGFIPIIHSLHLAYYDRSTVLLRD